MNKVMPISGYFNREEWEQIRGYSIPWEMIAPHELQAQKNHYQTLQKLAERGGLDESESIAILEDRPWKKMGEVEAREKLKLMIKEYEQRRNH
jgi:hypothetical protein